MKTALFNYTGELKIFLKTFHQQTSITYSFKDNQSVKHLVEAMGVPHTEVGVILVNGKSVDESYLVADQDFIEILPIDPQSLYLQTPAFLLDNHLGRLAAFLRMLGFDSLYRNDFQDNELAEIASQTNRVLLTRDLRLLMRKSIRTGYWLRSKDPQIQVVEVVKRFGLSDRVEPFKRCMRCNALLVPVEKDQILSQLQPLTKKYYDEYRQCPGCDQVFWQGSHYQRMKEFIDMIRQG